jgi:hypothetical protein
MSNLSQRLKSAAKFASETVEPVPGVRIEIRELTAGARMQFGVNARKAEREKNDTAQARLGRDLLAATAHDPETGERVWPAGKEHEIDDLPGTMPDDLAEVALKVNGLDGAAKSAAKND